MADIASFAKHSALTQENYNIWNTIKDDTAKLSIYFDTADVIDMLIGIKAIYPIPEYGIRWDTYNEAKQLVYAVAYKGWLGTIRLLPPHFSELYDKLKMERFHAAHYSDVATMEKDFWGNDDILSKEVAQLINNDEQPSNEQKKKWLDQFIHQAPHIFQGAYLLDNKADWRNRYAYLKTNEKLKFDEHQASTNNIGETPLFKALYRALNETRSSTTANNYIDALALSMFDHKLAEAEATQQAPPFFYAEQNHIHEAVIKVSKLKIDNRHPFYYNNQTHKLRFLAVRRADFFFLYAILRTVKNDFTKLWEPLKTYLESIAKEKNSDVRRLGRGKVDPQLRLFFMEFFQTWWQRDGIEDLKKPFPLKSIDSTLIQDINEYMQVEFQSLAPQIQYGPEVLNIIRQTLFELKHVVNRVKELYADPFSMYAVHEFGPRFSFGPSVCHEIQSRFDELKEVAFADASNDIGEIQSSIVTSISNVLTSTETENREQLKKMLNSLASALGILWLLNKFELITQICRTIRGLTHLMANNGDKYPSSPFAIMHVAALLSTPNPDINEVLRIIQCVEQKYGFTAPRKSYKIWLALSYAYYRLADRVFHKVFFIPEDLDDLERDSGARQIAIGYLKKTLAYAEAAYNFLHNKSLNPDPDKLQAIPRYNRNLRAAQNNIIFCQTILLPAESLLDKLHPIVRGQEFFSQDPQLWHDNRYSDTIGRYYYRLARIAHKPIFIEKARFYNKKSITSKGLAEKSLPQQLHEALATYFPEE